MEIASMRNATAHGLRTGGDTGVATGWLLDLGEELLSPQPKRAGRKSRPVRNKG